MGTSPKPFVAVLAGGFSAEFEVSVKSGDAVFASLSSEDFELILVHVTAEGWIADPYGARLPVDLTSFGIADKLFDAAFIAVHGTPAEDGLIPGYLDMLGVPHTTSGALGSAVAFHKAMAKQLAVDCGAELAQSVTVRQNFSNAKQLAAKVGYPLFVKPNQNGSSCGISLVKDESELAAALQEASTLDAEVLVEQAITDGVEVTCGVYQWQGNLEVLPLTEVISDAKHDFFNYKAKYTKGEAQEITPARIPEEEANTVRDASLHIYEALELRGLARADYILKDGKAWFLEYNTVPGLSPASIVPKMAIAAGLTLGAFYSRLLHECMRNQPRRGKQHAESGPKQGLIH